MRPPDANPFLRQRFYNRASQASWQAFEAHRQQVTARLQSAGAGQSLCILGAGNCNDLNLPELALHWGRIRLVDIDAEAMRQGVANQFPLPNRDRIELSTCDLTGALEHVHDLPRLRTALTKYPAVAQLGEQFHTVASTCLLSQLIGILRQTVGESSPEFRSLTEAMRLQHLRTVAELTAPGGTAILFTDFVSSETQPELLHAPPHALPAIMKAVVENHGCFSGMNPLIIQRLLTEEPLASYWAKPPAMSAPWVWNLGPRSYLVTAITCRRKPATQGAGVVFA